MRVGAACLELWYSDPGLGDFCSFASLSSLFSPAACKESKRPLEVSQRSEEMGLILGICAGGLAVLILLLGAIIVIIRKG